MVIHPRAPAARISPCGSARPTATGASRATWCRSGTHMVDVSVHDGIVTFEVEGADKLWALRSRLEIPLAHIRGVRVDPEVARGWWHGIRMPGTQLPGVITAGTFYQHGKRVFWDVH